LDWLDNRKIPWRVYHDGFFSFFTLLLRLEEVFGPWFRPIDDLKVDIRKPSENMPKVIIIEPSYYDPPILSGHPNDNHPPLPVGPGEVFLKKIYDILTSNPTRWKKTVMILTYDEHGGFYDHVTPLPIPYDPPQGNYRPFKCTGVRVPSIIISPLVSAGRVHPGDLDHTSILQFIAERFDPKSGYSPAVKSRRDQYGIGSVSDVLDLDENSIRDDIPKSPDYTYDRTKPLTPVEPDKEKGLMEKAFIEAGITAVKNQPTKVGKKYPELITWYKKTMG
jgi:phospholipase C